MGWDDGPKLPREITPTEDDRGHTARDRPGRRGLILAFIAADVVILVAVLVFFLGR